VLAMCCKLKGAYWFSEPDDPAKFNIMDYFDIISRPMDLSSVRRKLSHNCYVSAADFVEDMNLIWENCYKYNGEAHEISKCAKELQVGFNEYLSSSGLEKYLHEK
jgi:bromodomain-containing factor 1